MYIRETEILHAFAYDWKYKSIVDSSNFFLSELEEMKCCTNHEETANSGKGL